MEVKFEDFEADAMGMTENIYHALDIPGFSEARGAIEKYVGGKKDIRKTNISMMTVLFSWCRIIGILH